MNINRKPKLTLAIDFFFYDLVIFILTMVIGISIIVNIVDIINVEYISYYINYKTLFFSIITLHIILDFFPRIFQLTSLENEVTKNLVIVNLGMLFLSFIIVYIRFITTYMVLYYFFET